MCLQDKGLAVPLAVGAAWCCTAIPGDTAPSEQPFPETQLPQVVPLTAVKLPGKQNGGKRQRKLIATPFSYKRRNPIPSRNATKSITGASQAYRLPLLSLVCHVPIAQGRASHKGQRGHTSHWEMSQE